MKAAIAGVGGIGSNVAVHLVRNRICELRLIDFDRVEPSNLNRQFYFRDQIGKLKVEMLSENLYRIDPEVSLETVAMRLDANTLQEAFEGCDIIVEGLDNADDKKMLIEWSAASNKPIVSANGIAGSDLTAVTGRTFGNCHVIGDFSTDCNDARLYSHKVSYIAARMAGKTISLLNMDR